MNETDPKVSVIIPTYNVDKYIQQTLESVLYQGFKDYEVIVVDDGSTDDTSKILEQFSSSIRIIYQQNSGGPARPRNVGIAHAKGEYVAIFDSDDLMMPHKLALSVELLKRQPELGMVFTDFAMCDEHGVMLPGAFLKGYPYFQGVAKTCVGENQFILKGRDVFEGLFFENFVGTSGVIVPREVFSKIGGFDEGLSHGGLDDRDMWFRISREYNVGFISTQCHVYRVRKGSVSKRALDSTRGRVQVIQRYMNETRSERVKKQALSMIAKNLNSAGYFCMANGNFTMARQFYFYSLKTTFSLSAVRGLFITSLGHSAIGLLKKARTVLKSYS